MRKLIILFGFLVFATLPAFAGSFPDVAEDHENFDAIEYLDDQGIISGYQDGTFGPDDQVSRAQAAKIIVSSFGIEHDRSFDVLFPDVTKDQWFFTFVMAGEDAGVISGYSDGKFKPSENVNLAETLKMIVLASGVELPSDVSEDVFVDVGKEVWYAPHALYAKNKNMIFPDDYGKLYADQPMTRASFAEVVYRMLVVLEEGGDPFPLHLNWPTYSGGVFPFKIKYDDVNWTVSADSSQVIFYKPDREFMQFSPGRLYINSAVLWVTRDENSNNLSSSQYFENLKMAFPYAGYTEFNLRGFSAFEIIYPNDRIVDWYVYLDDGSVLAVYTQYGNGILGFQNQQVLKAMLSTLEYAEAGVGGNEYSALLSEILESVLVEGMGTTMLDKLPDKLIIETDTIGVGTGPVDYYYSETLDYTFKYERESDVILDTRQGQTTAF